jgi:ADP-heptose:LPS heptosyltransferase
MHKKNWLDDYWVKVIEYLSNNLNCQIFFSGGKKDIELYNNLLNKCDKLKNIPINICGKYSVIESMALIKNVDLVIGVDSCAVHIAAAVGAPSILLNGPTSLIRWKPRSDKCIVLTKNFECSPCFLEKNGKKLCKHTMAKCMIAITPDMVINEINKLGF